MSSRPVVPKSSGCADDSLSRTRPPAALNVALKRARPGAAPRRYAATKRRSPVSCATGTSATSHRAGRFELLETGYPMSRTIPYLKVAHVLMYSATIAMLARLLGLSDSSDPVSPPRPVATVAVTPSANALIVGQTAALVATAKDASGNVIAGRAVQWATSNASIATVSAAGVVTAVAEGTATVSATVEGKTGQAARHGVARAGGQRSPNAADRRARAWRYPPADRGGARRCRRRFWRDAPSSGRQTRRPLRRYRRPDWSRQSRRATLTLRQRSRASRRR